MDRRTLVALIAAGLVHPPRFALAQAARTPRIGFLSLAASPGNLPTPAMREGLRDLGYVEGRTVEFVVRTADGRPERLAGLASELVALRVDAIVSIASEATRAAKLATSTVPIVFIGPSYPVEEGLVASLARPGGNVTGFTLANSDHVAKHLQLLRDVAPKLADVAILYSPANPGNTFMLRDTERTAESMRVRTRAVPIENPDQIDHALAAIERQRPDAMIVMPTPLLNVNAQRIADLATKLRIPGSSAQRVFADRGLLFGYAADFTDLERKATAYLDRILKGAKPGELPVERPSRYILVVNARTARAIGITIPSALLLRADEVIQ